MDGNVLEDPVWQRVVPTEGFWQTRPVEGQAASERTEVRVAYTQDTLYFGVVCYDRDPRQIIVSDSRRDASLEDTDSFQIILDTYRDRQNGFVFGTNPAAIEYDGQVRNEGQGGGRRGRQTGGSGGGFNLNWDGAWEVRTEVDEKGWSIEFAIPFRTIRYPSSEEQIWGINFQRNIRRHNEIVFWAPLGRQYNLYRLSDAGSISELRIPEQRNFKVIPYVLGQARSQGTQNAVRTGEVGLDAKYSITPSLTLDFTYNTDFAQVEVDEQQINLDRFNLFFPEKRPFFLENAGLFSVGDSGEAELFFSRRIGIGDRGTAIPILTGARVTGKLRGTNVGFMNMQTEEDGITPANNFTVGRISRELPNRSSLGAIFINRQATGDIAAADNYNRTYGFDGRWGIGEYGSVTGFLAGTQTPGLESSEYAFKLGTMYQSPGWRLSTNYTQLGENFNPEVGFLARSGGYRKYGVAAFHTYRANFGRLHEIRPHVNYDGYWTPDGFHQSGRVHADSHWEFKSGHEVHTGMNFVREGLRESFEIFPGIDVPAGTYDDAEAQIVFNTNDGAWLSFNTRTTIGGFFGGDRVQLSHGLKFRTGEAFTTDFSWTYNDIDLPAGQFATNLGRLRTSYSFTPRVFVQAFLQYNDRANTWSSNIRFGWLQDANTGLFIVYNDTRGVDSFTNPLLVPDRSLTIKYNRIFDLLR